jgi:hypothetical protein
MLQLPLWTVTEHIKPSDPENVTRTKPGTMLAFGSSDKLLRFMTANVGGEWKMEMAADREGLIILIADLHRLEIETIRLNPELDGTGGEQITLADLVAFAGQLD